MKLFNVIQLWDCYVVAEDPEAAREALLSFIREGEIPPSEQVARQVTSDRQIRQAWKDERPPVGSDVSDADFEKLKGKTTMDVFNMLHTKQQELPGTDASKASVKKANAK